MAVCWKPIELSSSRLQLELGDCLELDAALDPLTASVDSVTLTPIAPANPSSAEGALVAALAARIAAEAEPALATCRTFASLRAALRTLAIRVGRAADLGAEMAIVAEKVPTSLAAPAGDGGKVTLLLRPSCLRTLSRCALAIVIDGEDPNTPLTHELREVQLGNDGADADACTKAIAKACDKHATGFGRLGHIYESVAVALAAC